MPVYNVTEHLARNMLLSDQVQKTLTCHCEKCQDDVLAHALNHLPARYVSTEEGGLYVKASFMQLQRQFDVIQALVRAASTVSNRPHHLTEPTREAIGREPGTDTNQATEAESE